jgi:phage gpG-like protein
MAVKGTKVTVFNTKAFGFIAIKKQIEVSKEVKLSALAIETKAKELVPVDNGDLRKSIGIDFSHDRLNATIETKLPYAAYIEFGTPVGTGAHGGPRPYLRPAYNAERGLFIQRVKKILTG